MSPFHTLLHLGITTDELIVAGIVALAAVAVIVLMLVPFVRAMSSKPDAQGGAEGDDPPGCGGCGCGTKSCGK